jgi:thymidylate synthase ThyX
MNYAYSEFEVNKSSKSRYLTLSEGKLINYPSFISNNLEYMVIINFVSEGIELIEDNKDSFEYFASCLDSMKNNYKSNWLDVLDYWTEPTEFHEIRKTVYMEIDRCTGESFIRHRVFSKARQSTRACDYTKDKYEGITCITPCWEVSPQASQILDLALSASETYYAELRKLGWTAEQARIVLPFDIKSPLVMTGTVDEWKEFCDVRADGVVGRPHPQSVEITEQIKKEMFK